MPEIPNLDRQIPIMKIIVSPAKTLDYESELPTKKHTQPVFLTQSRTVHKVLKTKKPAELMELMHISENLADLNWQRNKKWKTPFTEENARPAVYAFAGDVYTGLDAYSLPVDKLDDLQHKLRILSGLYGLLKPLDLIQPYRLEMGTSMAVGESDNLYRFWKERLTSALNKELKKGEILVNLASKEYSDAIDLKKIKVQVITPEFKDYKNGKLAMISFFAKKARGMMVRYIIENDITDAKGLEGFDYEGYRFDPNLSKPNHPVFTR